MSKGGNSTVSTQVDPATRQYVEYQRRVALGYEGGPGYGGAPSQPPAYRPFGGGLGFGGGFGHLGMLNRFGQQPPPAPGAGQPIAPNYPPELLAAEAQLGRYAGAGNVGLEALSGGNNQLYNADKLRALDPIWNQQRQLAMGAVGDQAQMQGAFGGSRQGVAEGVALGQVGMGQAQQEFDAYRESLARAGMLANLGLGAGQALPFLRQQYGMGQLGLLNAGMGPYGQTQTTQMQSDPFSQLLGAGLSVGSMFLGPGGWLGKAALSGAGQQVMGTPMTWPDFG